jgi:serine/threonine protein kinase
MKRYYFQRLPHLRQAVVLNHLGDGGMSNVHVVQCVCSVYCKEQFVIKQMKQICTERSLLHEYKIGQRLNHQNIIKTLDFDSVTFCLAFENFTGIDLFDYLDIYSNKNSFFLELCYSQTLDAIKYLHDAGIAHMDLKLENIVINLETKQVKLIDFGHAKYFEIDNMYIFEHSLKGTDTYFPPEYFTSTKFYPDKTDIWCCGLILYNIVYDKCPWKFADALCDKNYLQHYESLLSNRLDNELFPHLEWNLINWDTLRYAFENTLHYNPAKRCTIDELQNIFSD